MSADEDLSAKPPHQQRMIARHHAYDWVFEPRTYRAGRLRKLQGYYGCISQVDHMVGLALQRLEQIPEASTEYGTILGYLDWLTGLPWQENVLDFHKTERAVRTASVWQVRQPMYTGSIGKWKRYEAHLGELRDALAPDGTH